MPGGTVGPPGLLGWGGGGVLRRSEWEEGERTAPTKQAGEESSAGWLGWGQVTSGAAAAAAAAAVAAAFAAAAAPVQRGRKEERAPKEKEEIRRELLGNLFSIRDAWRAITIGS